MRGLLNQTSVPRALRRCTAGRGGDEGGGGLAGIEKLERGPADGHQRGLLGVGVGRVWVQEGELPRYGLGLVPLAQAGGYDGVIQDIEWSPQDQDVTLRLFDQPGGSYESPVIVDDDGGEAEGGLSDDSEEGGIEA